MLATPAQAQQTALCRGGVTGQFLCPSPWTQSWIPPGIPATKIGAATVDDSEFACLDGCSSNLQAQINAIVAASAKGSAVTLLVMGNGIALSSWVSGQYAGLGSIAGSNASPPGAWRAPAAGTVKNWYYTSSLANPSGAGRVVTVHKAATASGGCGAYAATPVTITMPLAGQGAFTATSLAVNQGDCLLFVQNFTLNTGAGGSTIIVAQYVPN